MNINLDGRVVLVTGGLGGVGAATVKALSAAGATVALTYADGAETADQASDLIAIAPERISVHPLDLLSGPSMDACFGSVVDRWGGIDVLVNNAAVGSATVEKFANDRDGQDAVMMLVNANGTLMMSQRFVQMIGSRAMQVPAKLINISSVGGGIAAFPHFRLSDGMSKSAVAFLTRQLAAEHAHNGLDVFAVCPGATNTPMFQASSLNGLSDTERLEFTRGLPKGRLIDPSEIADIIVFLASSHSTVLHGSIIDASMGLGSRPGILTEASGPHAAETSQYAATP